MSLEEPYEPTFGEGVEKSEVVRRILIINKIRQDVKRFLGFAIGLAIYRYVLGLPWPPLRLAASIVIGMGFGLLAGWTRTKVYDLIVIDIRNYPRRIGVSLWPRFRFREPRKGYIEKSVSKAGTDVVVITNFPRDTNELLVTKEKALEFAMRLVELEKALKDQQIEIEVEALRKARELFMEYLQAREALRSERRKTTEGSPSGHPDEITGEEEDEVK